ncbi:MAG: hypothetical protein J6S21_03695, partial [Victivallales bacterium]|nr:hypothetical protein [Victivallales bacterium]
MHLPVDLFLALRYLKPKRSFISVISLLSILGPMLGVAILIIVTSVMSGFDHDIRTGIMNMQAHLTFYPQYESHFTNPAGLLKRIEEAGREFGVEAAPVIEGTALIQLRDTVQP